MGSIYQKRGRDGQKSGPLWIKYYRGGVPVRESTGTTKRKEAERLLKEREGSVAKGEPILPRADRICYEEIAQDLREHYRTSGDRDLDEAEFRLKHLDGFFRNARVAAIGGAEITRYAADRQRQGAANGTINRELATLGRMLKLAYEHHKCLRLPVIHRLKEAAPRRGFFEPAEFEAVKKRLPEDLTVAVTIAYLYGWRMQSEVLALERRHVNLDAGTLTLDANMTKTWEARTVYLTPEVKALLAGQLERVDTLSRKTGRIIPSLFPHLGARHRGEPILDFRKRWLTACRKAGVPGRIRHDFRRTAVRNMVNAGVAENVAMTVTGHKTRSVFDRYHIVSPADLKAVAVKLSGTV